VALWFIPAWSTVVRPLHDALIEDALDNAERETTGTVAEPAGWSWWVRTLRRVLGSRSYTFRRGIFTTGPPAG
jgi:hypothetical protein